LAFDRPEFAFDQLRINALVIYIEVHGVPWGQTIVVSTAERRDEKSWGRKNHKKCPETQSVRAQIYKTITCDGFNLSELVAE
jgi:hypothetical protein